MTMLLKWFKYLTYAIVFGLLVLLFLEGLVYYKTSSYMYDVPTTIPKNKVGLLLGTSKHTNQGYQNLYYRSRIKAAKELFDNQRVEYILVSGDNGTIYYNEPSTIKKDLMAIGIPEDRIILDYAGFRTLDSVVRAKEVFGESSYTIISQPFHNRRALYIARSKGIEAIAYNADSVSWRYGKKVILRERLARVKMFLDLLMNKQPKFLGEKISIG